MKVVSFAIALDTQARPMPTKGTAEPKAPVRVVCDGSALTSMHLAALCSARAAASTAAFSRLSRPLASADLASASCSADFLASRSCGTIERRKVGARVALKWKEYFTAGSRRMNEPVQASNRKQSGAAYRIRDGVGVTCYIHSNVTVTPVNT